jgi:hypothetical protein
MPESGADLQLDSHCLGSPVRCALGSDQAEVQSWEVLPLGHVFNPVTGGLYRVRGSATTSRTSVSWSMVLKVSRDPEEREHQDQQANSYWKREFLAYQSGLLANLPAGVRAPRCYGTEERPDGSAWIWLEDVTDTYGSPWPLERYALAARHVGQFNGAYLAGRPIPDVPWLSSGGGRSDFEWLGPNLERVRALGDHPLIRREWLDESMLDRSLRLWRERQSFFSALGRLPRTLGHLDFFRLNLFAARSPDGSEETVAVDWARLGMAAVGEDLVPLVCASPLFGHEHVDRVRELGESCFAAYVAGLRDAGWRGDPGLVRLGYSAGVLRYCGTFTPLALDQPAMLTAVERAWGRYSDFLDRVVRIRPYVLDLADEARELMSRQG